MCLLHNLRFKPKFQKKYLAFFTIAPLLLATAIFRMPCPVCNGTGLISSTGMDKVNVRYVQMQELTTFLTGCDAFRIYPYNIVVTLENDSDKDAGGYMSFTLVNQYTGQIMDQQYGIAEVPAMSSTTLEFVEYFQISVTVDMPDRTGVNAKVLRGDVGCLACGGKDSVPGSGKVALNSWPVINANKQNFKDTVHVSKPFLPPLFVEQEGTAGVDY
jgi:hypothetical protein